MNKNDARYIKTHNALRHTFEDLVQNADQKDITVSSITRAAGVNRRTFYLHYETVDDMYDELALEQAEALGVYIKQAAELHPGDMLYLVSGIIELICRNKPLHKRIICSDEYSRLFQKISSRLSEDPAVGTGGAQPSADPFFYRLTMESKSFTIMNSIRHWLAAEEPVSSEELARFIVSQIE